MARSIKEYNERVSVFLDTAQRLFLEKGYEETSVNDILEAMGVAKGTFYYYFESKKELLEMIADRFGHSVCREVKDIADRSDLHPLEKIQLFFTSIRTYKLQDVALLKLMYKLLYADENLLLRHKIYQHLVGHLFPDFARIIREGAEAGVLHPMDGDYEGTAEILFALFEGMSEILGPIVIEIEQNPEILAVIEKKLYAIERSMGCLLGAAEGMIRIVDRQALERLARVVRKEKRT